MKRELTAVAALMMVASIAVAQSASWRSVANPTVDLAPVGDEDGPVFFSTLDLVSWEITPSGTVVFGGTVPSLGHFQGGVWASPTGSSSPPVRLLWDRVAACTPCLPLHSCVPISPVQIRVRDGEDPGEVFVAGSNTIYTVTDCNSRNYIPAYPSFYPFNPEYGEPALILNCTQSTIWVGTFHCQLLAPGTYGPIELRDEGNPHGVAWIETDGGPVAFHLYDQCEVSWGASSSEAEALIVKSDNASALTRTSYGSAALANPTLFRNGTGNFNALLAGNGDAANSLGWHMVAFEGQQPPGLPGKVFTGYFDGSFNSDLRVALVASTNDGVAREGVWYADFASGSFAVNLVTLSGNAVPGLNGRTFTSFSSPVVGTSGKVYFLGNFNGGSGIFCYDPAESRLRRVVSTADPDCRNFTISSISQYYQVNADEVVVFLGTADGVDAIIAATEDNKAIVLARAGEVLNGSASSLGELIAFDPISGQDSRSAGGEDGRRRILSDGNEVVVVAQFYDAGENVYYDGIVAGAFYRPCLADFDNSGFVDIDDYSAFIAAFELGTVCADVDQSGFVDGDDFDFFVAHFENGC